jgi:3-oxoacyl-(acyl-carrier-protein) synthase
MLFPETVINAPASHLAAYLGGAALTYSLVGDQTAFVQAMAVGAEWLVEGRVDLCIVVSTEETARSLADALNRFGRGLVASEGAGALLLAREPAAGHCVQLESITDAHLYAGHPTKVKSAAAMRSQLAGTGQGELLVDARCGVSRVDHAETVAWQDWAGARLSPRMTLGESLTAATAWQCIAACMAIAGGETKAANVSAVGGNQQAIGIRFKGGILT